MLPYREGNVIHMPPVDLDTTEEDLYRLKERGNILWVHKLIQDHGDKAEDWVKENMPDCLNDFHKYYEKGKNFKLK